MVYPGKYFVYTLRRMHILLFFGGAYYRCLLGLLSLWFFFQVLYFLADLLPSCSIDRWKWQRRRKEVFNYVLSSLFLPSCLPIFLCTMVLYLVPMFTSVISSWCIKPFISIKYCSLFLVTIFSFKVYFVWYKYSQSSLLLVAIYMIIFFHSFNLSLSVSLNLKHVVFQQFIVVFSPCLTICLLLDCLIQSHLMLLLI